jgi:basic membrane protein A and related proteins
MRKSKIVALSAVLALGFAACGDDSDESTESTPATEPAAEEPTETTPAETTPATDSGSGEAPEGELKMTILFDLKGRGDKSFNDSAAVGLDEAKAEFGYTVTEEVRQGSDEAQLLQKAADEGSTLIIGVGFAWGEAMAEAAAANPDINYAIVDSVVDQPNVSGLVFAANQGSFLVGAAAALKSTTGKIGFIGGVDIPLIQDFYAGYEAGAKAVNPDIEIDTQYISPAGDFSGFNDPDKAKTIALKMYEDGSDIVYHAAGGSGDGLFAAAKEVNDAGTAVWAIGVDSDQATTVSEDLAPYILTSMLKRVDVSVYETMKAHAEGTFAGGVRAFTVADGGLGYATTGGNVDDIKDQLDAFAAQIASGEIEVPTVTG